MYSMLEDRAVLLVMILLCVSMQSCVSTVRTESHSIPASDAGSAGRFAGTRWLLVEIQSMDDTIGTSRPKDPNLYTMDLNADGTITMRLNCNRGHSQWSANPVGNGESGSFRIGPLAMTRAQCPPPSLDMRIAKDMEFVRSFIIRDGQLYLNLMADGGIYVWEPRVNDER